MKTTVTVIQGPFPDLDQETVEDVAQAGTEGLDAGLRVRVVEDEAGFRSAVHRAAASGDAVVLMPGPELERGRLADAAADLDGAALWFTADATDDPGCTAEGQLIIQGRGLGGLTWAVRRVINRRRWPVETVSYGSHGEQFGELRLPAGSAQVPVVVLVHGGFWRSRWQLDLMDALAVDLAQRGLASWNLEFRRPDRHGWQATTADLEHGIGAVAGLGPRVDAARTALVGHSAGAQLVIRAAADGNLGELPRLRVVVSLAGVVDLVATERRRLGEGAVAEALGGSPEEVPEVYAASSPIARLPLGVPQLVVQGTTDAPDLVEMNRRYASAARRAGDEVKVVEAAVDHFAVIDPASGVWSSVVAALQRRLASPDVTAVGYPSS